MRAGPGTATTGPLGFGVTWGGAGPHARRAITVAVAAALATSVAGQLPAHAAGPGSGQDVTVIVRELPGTGNGPERAVVAAGGHVGLSLDLIDGFTATLPADRVQALRATPGVEAVTEDASVQLHSTEVADQAGLPGSLTSLTRDVLGAANLWDRGITGRGVDVAVIDSGVVPVDGLATAGKVVYGPDLSSEGSVCSAGSCRPGPARNLDTYGHGTHIAGIIAGRDTSTPAAVTSGTSDSFTGVAPDARIVSVKVADAAGNTDVSQVLAAIEWVVKNRNRNGLSIRVLNLSFGTDGVQPYQLDPLAFAVEAAWHRGIVVVAAAGNSGYGTQALNNPANDPYVIAVGAADTRGTATPADDIVPAWSSPGDGVRNPDLVAPGQSVVSLRNPGSALDLANPQARTGERFFRGSGTSQAAAIVSGAAALLLSQRPWLTPDQVKGLLTATANPLYRTGARLQGSGLMDLTEAARTRAPLAVQAWPRSTGGGSIEAARGSHHVRGANGEIRGEVDVAGAAWRSSPWVTQMTADGMTWSGMTWSGMTWSGMTWSGMTWSGMTWSGMTWSGMTWSGMTWSGMTWSGESWG